MTEQRQRRRLRPRLRARVVALAAGALALTLTSCADAPVGRAEGALAAPVGYGAAGVGCSSTEPIAARELAVPVPFRRCLIGTRVGGPAKLVARIPRAGSQACRPAFVERAGAENGPSARRIDLCVSSSHAGIYAGVHRRAVAPACASTGKIDATSLSVPVPKADCSLVGRLVVFRQAGVHVPRTGGVCGSGLTPTYEVEVCVITDRFGTWATHHYYARPS